MDSSVDELRDTLTCIITRLGTGRTGGLFDIPYDGPTSWMHAGEAATAFIAAASKDGEDVRVFNLT